MCSFSPVAPIDSNLIMFINCKLAVLMLVLTFKAVHAGKIFGGQKAKPHSRPYMVLLERTLGNNLTRFCGGFLISQYFVITAAHCQAKSYEVILGLQKYNENKKMTKVSVKQAFPHEYYSSERDYANDIMLLKLSSKVKFSRKVQRIILPAQCDTSLPRSCSVAGWGQTNNEPLSRTLMEVNVTLSEKVDEDNVYYSEGEKGPGAGDSGGPLVCEDQMAYGVVSASRNLPSSTRQYKYTKIPDYRKWIDYIMNQN